MNCAKNEKHQYRRNKWKFLPETKKKKQKNKMNNECEYEKKGKINKD